MAGFLAGSTSTARPRRRGRPDQLRHARSRHVSSPSSSRRSIGWPLRSSRGGPNPSPRPEVAAILGRWWSEGNEFVFCWREASSRSAPGAPRGCGPRVSSRRATVLSGRLRAGARRAVPGRRRALIWRLPVHARQAEPAPRATPRRTRKRRPRGGKRRQEDALATARRERPDAMRRRGERGNAIAATHRRKLS